jgi:anaerobic magnesium-protoporphyrin IX monomethyl ester cyclase
MKIMISYPPLAGAGSPMLTQNRQFQWYHVPSYIYPLVPAMAATILQRDGFDVIWNDAITEEWTYPQFIEFFEREGPDLIAFETKTPVVRQHWRIVDQLKRINPRCATVLMGDHVTALPQESLENSSVDYVITGGDYDFALLGLARHLRDGTPPPGGLWFRQDGGIATTGPGKLDNDLTTLPFHDRVLTRAHLYGEKWKKRTPFFYTMVGRDCHWGRCTFCAWTVLYPNFRLRHYTQLLDEIGYLIKEHGAKEIFDDTGTFPAGGWLSHFCQGMIDRGYNKEVLFSCNMRYGYIGKPDLLRLMRKAGFRKMKMGLESANQKTLDRLNKGVTVEQIIEESRMIAEARLDIQLTIMVGYPWETHDDVQRTIDLARRLMADGHAEMLQATVVVPYPGTPLYRQALENGWFKDGFDPTDWDRFDMRELVFKTPDMEPAEAMELCAQVYESFLTPRYIWRHVSHIRSLEDLDYVYHGAKAVIGHLLDFLNSRGRQEKGTTIPAAKQEQSSQEYNE